MTYNTTSKKGLANADPATRQKVSSAGGTASSKKQDMRELGRKGGQAAQASGNAHRLTDEERSKGGSNSPGNFKNDPTRASVAGRVGGSN